MLASAHFTMNSTIDGNGMSMSETVTCCRGAWFMRQRRPDDYAYAHSFFLPYPMRMYILAESTAQQAATEEPP